MTLEHGRRELEQLGETDLAKTISEVHDVFRKRYPDLQDISLPSVATPASNATAAVEKPASKTLETSFEIPTVDEKTYRSIREKVEATGYKFIATIRPVSIKQLLAEDMQREFRRYANGQEKIMVTVISPEMEVAINPDKFRIERSNDVSTDEQKEKIKEEEARWKKRLPEDIRPFVGMHMVGPSTLSQLEDAYMDEGKGVLMPDYHARTDVEIVPGAVAVVGRPTPKSPRTVLDWHRRLGHRLIFAVSVVVLPRKLAA